MHSNGFGNNSVVMNIFFLAKNDSSAIQGSQLFLRLLLSEREPCSYRLVDLFGHLFLIFSLKCWCFSNLLCSSEILPCRSLFRLKNYQRLCCSQLHWGFPEDFWTRPGRGVHIVSATCFPQLHWVLDISQLCWPCTNVQDFNGNCI